MAALCLRKLCRIRNYSYSTVVKEMLKEDAIVKLDPLKHPDYFGVHKLFTVADLIDARVHLGHKEGTLNDRMRPFIFGSRLGQLIFDLDQTSFHLRQALNFLAHIAYREGIVLFVSKHRQTSLLVEKTAKECGEFANTRPWQVGLFTNSTMEFGTVTRLPDVVVVLHTLDTVFTEHVAVNHSNKMLIPTIAIVDTNCDPNLVTYPIPGNDDTPLAIELYLRLFKETILRAKDKRKEDTSNEPSRV